MLKQNFSRQVNDDKEEDHQYYDDQENDLWIESVLDVMHVILSSWDTGLLIQSRTDAFCIIIKPEHFVCKVGPINTGSNYAHGEEPAAEHKV